MKDCLVEFKQNRIYPGKIIMKAKCLLGNGKPMEQLSMCSTNETACQQADRMQENMKSRCPGVEECILSHKSREQRAFLTRWM